MLNVFQHPWSALSASAALFISREDAKARRGRACREAAFHSNRTASRAVERKRDLSVPSHLLRVFASSRETNWRRIGEQAPGMDAGTRSA
jgi:hypothetical protein